MQQLVVAPAVSNGQAMMKHLRDGVVLGVAAFVAAKYGLEGPTSQSLLVGAGVGVATYAALSSTSHAETRWA